MNKFRIGTIFERKDSTTGIVYKSQIIARNEEVIVCCTICCEKEKVHNICEKHNVYSNEEGEYIEFGTKRIDNNRSEKEVMYAA